jgi:hypothetical protein
LPPVWVLPSALKSDTAVIEERQGGGGYGEVEV